MSPDKLVRMANQIAAFFTAQGGEEAAAGVADHLNRFWDPRMRGQLLAMIAAGETEGLDTAVLAAGPLVRPPQAARGERS